MLGLPEIQAACGEAAQGEVCQPANINSPGQIVISGSKAAVERAAELCKQKGAKRAVMLPVSAPFHCALMQPAQDRLATDLKSLHMHKPEVPVLCNVDAKLVTDADVARDALIRQVTGAVRWVESIQGLVAAGVEQFIEVGPGKVLTGLMKQIDKSKPAFNVEDEASLQAVKNHFDQKKSEAE
jgi:[acyl-carrier-protein] S-malonyltransferase